MFDIEEVLDCFCTFAKIDKAKKEIVKPLGLAAIERVINNLKYGANIIASKNLLFMLCVALTFYQYALIKAQNNAGTIRVGDISVNEDAKKTLEAAIKLKEYYLKATRDCMKIKFFEFKQI